MGLKEQHENAAWMLKAQFEVADTKRTNDQAKG